MYDLIIIGGGVAAFSSALYAARRGLNLLVLAKDIGGQANFTDQIENYPGILETGGFDLVDNIRKQALGFGAKLAMAEVEKISVRGRATFGEKKDDFFVLSALNKQYKAQSVILAFGKTPMDLNVEGEQELKGKGISYCATCDATLFKNKVVAIAGVGDLALDATILSAKFAKKVYLLSKTKEVIGHPGLMKKIKKLANVELVPFIKILKIEGADFVTGLRLENLKNQQAYSLPIDAMLVELGYITNSQFLQGFVNLTPAGEVIIDKNQATSVEGIFAAGDVTDSTYKQAVISAGEGATAALAAFDWLQRKQGKEGLTSDWTEIKRVK